MHSPRGGWAIVSATFAATLCACSGSSDDANELGTAEQPLYGPLETVGCTAQQIQTLGAAKQVGMKLAMSDAFGACLRHRVFEDYWPCGDSDPFDTSSKSTQYDKALAIMRSGNTAGVGVTCSDLDPGVIGKAYIGGYGDGHEDMWVDQQYLDGTFPFGLDDWELGDVAGTIWHEAMHQQGYGDGLCGQPVGFYDQQLRAMSYIANQCMSAANLSGRTLLQTEDGRRRSLGIGLYLASDGYWNIPGTSLIRLRPGPAIRMRICAGVDESGQPTSCTVFNNASTAFGSVREALATTAAIDIQPLVLLFSQTDYRGAVQPLTFGEHRANAGALSVVGNDQTRSVYVAPGARVRVCSDEGGVAGHGAGSCLFYEHSIPTSALAGISYAEVQPVVTGFSESGLGGGERDSLGAGRWRSPLGNDDLVSLVVPNGLTARACSDWSTSGAGTCFDYTRSNFELFFGLADQVSFLEVTPALLGTYALTVNRAFGSGPGTVNAAPFMTPCTGPCTASFPVRNEVKLTPTSPGYTAEWTGCDRVGLHDCYVTMTAARTVKVKFKALNTCVDECLAGCAAEEQFTTAQCLQMCAAECGPG
jgi:hypothetical protein